MLRKTGRPCVLIIRLNYKGRNQDFAVPLRSNISANTPKNQYFNLPTRSTTKPGNRHGIHYIKMFPVSKKYLLRYRTEGNNFATLIKNVVDKNEKQIISECREYLDRYSNGEKPEFATDIDTLIDILETLNQLC